MGIFINLDFFFSFSFFIAVWAETGEFRDNSHSVMTSVAGSMDHSHLNFQTAASRNRSRDRKNDG